ncbi:hypothetical protein DICPUDRAFT_93349 [Dictyostelium purpureum]|uniref:Uncharacterized protein n=1 Tax=Dictyostelium purpureum TaxID=5786 RepID=F1A648_DICPU|nr:uncharacterized protein DICPUDRAFT_93349 [Dictyostelium purpureum]EGC28330.1 hypothetical protein DICPUDRAFT_93349 [Dictyostelium purpureum]|eukprot:XP_003295142.1 hypothetical protein DICPUDRAFT_93349 [Dictyostelium purpureum]
MEGNLMNSEISPSFAMKINGYNANDIWGGNIEDINPSSTPLMSCPMRHQIIRPATTTEEYYNFDFRMGAPIVGVELYATPTLTHG